MHVVSFCVVSPPPPIFSSQCVHSSLSQNCVPKLYVRTFATPKQLEGHYFYGHFGTGGEGWPFSLTQAEDICGEEI